MTSRKLMRNEKVLNRKMGHQRVRMVKKYNEKIQWKRKKRISKGEGENNLKWGRKRMELVENGKRGKTKLKKGGKKDGEKENNRKEEKTQ